MFSNGSGLDPRGGDGGGDGGGGFGAVFGGRPRGFPVGAFGMVSFNRAYSVSCYHLIRERQRRHQLQIQSQTTRRNNEHQRVSANLICLSLADNTTREFPMASKMISSVVGETSRAQNEKKPK